jgi:hypothetical protein
LHVRGIDELELNVGGAEIPKAHQIVDVGRISQLELEPPAPSADCPR